MNETYPSVDEFVAAYLANCEASAGCESGVMNAGLNGLAFAHGAQPPYQQPVSTQPFPGAIQTSTAVPGVSQPNHNAKAWEQSAGDVYMQPYDQTAQQLPMAQFGVGANWQLQQQQLQLLNQQQQQLQFLHQQQQQLQQHQQEQAMPGIHAAASESYQASAGATAAGRSVTPKTARQGGSTNGKQQGEASSTATGNKRSTRSKSSSRGAGRKSQQYSMDGAVEQPLLRSDAAGGQLYHNLGHSNSAPPLSQGTAAAAVAVAAAVAAAEATGPRSLSSNFPDIYAQPGNLSSVLTMQQMQAAQQQQQQQQQVLNLMQQEPEEPDMSHLTVMQRYHARRKLAVQRMEREVEEKIAQLALLEQENRQLKWQAHILENMLLDMDKQMELMSSEELPDAAQWLTLLGMGTNAAVGASGRIARTLHKMLEGASTVDISGWTAQHCRQKWLTYLEQLRPLVEEAEAAHATYRATQGASSEQQSSAVEQQQRRRPQRAAAAAAVAVIKQEAAEVLGIPPLPVCPTTSNIPDVPLPLPQYSLASSPAAAAAAGAAADGTAAAGGVQPMDGIQPSNSLNSTGDGGQQCPAASEHSTSSMNGSEFSHGPGVEGVPPLLLSRIEELVMQNFYWLLAIMTRNPVLTYEFISVDLIEGSTPLPPQHDELWSAAVGRADMTLEQQQESCTCLQVARRCMAQVMEERAEITAAMSSKVTTFQTETGSQAWLASDMLNQNQVDQTVDRMRANIRKESVVRNLVGFYCINVVSLFQLAKLCLSCSPWFSMAWRVAGAVETKLAERMAGEAAQQQQQQQGGHSTRSSARLAAQR